VQSAVLLTAIADQMNPKNNFESVAKQRFQNYSWFGLERDRALRVSSHHLSYKIRNWF